MVFSAEFKMENLCRMIRIRSFVEIGSFEEEETRLFKAGKIPGAFLARTTNVD